MSPTTRHDAPLVDAVLHPTDLSEASENAFAHALALTLRRQASLTLLHVVPDDKKRSMSRFPAVRGTLERWGYLPDGASRSRVFAELGIGVSKVSIEGRRPVAAILEFLTRYPTDLLVLATSGLDGLPRWLRGSVAEPLARQSEVASLFVPAGSKGIVRLSDGRVSLRRVLVPVDHHPDPRAAVDIAARAATVLGDEQVELVLLHVGDPASAPQLELPQSDVLSWRTDYRRGKAVDAILNAVDEHAVDMVVMVTEGREGVLDALRGTTTEKVVRQSPVPVLAVPKVWVKREAGWLHDTMT